MSLSYLLLWSEKKKNSKVESLMEALKYSSLPSWFPRRGHASWQVYFVKQQYKKTFVWKSNRTLTLLFNSLWTQGWVKYFWNVPQASMQVGDFIPVHICSQIMKEAIRNCSCQICQRVKARGYHFDSFQHPFCWSSMLLWYYVPMEVMGEQRTVCFKINSKGFFKCICYILTSVRGLNLYLWNVCIWKRERKWKTINICWVFKEQTMWLYSF